MRRYCIGLVSAAEGQRGLLTHCSLFSRLLNLVNVDRNVSGDAVARSRARRRDSLMRTPRYRLSRLAEWFARRTVSKKRGKRVRKKKATRRCFSRPGRRFRRPNSTHVNCHRIAPQISFSTGDFRARFRSIFWISDEFRVYSDFGSCAHSEVVNASAYRLQRDAAQWRTWLLHLNSAIFARELWKLCEYGAHGAIFDFFINTARVSPLSRLLNG